VITIAIILANKFVRLKEEVEVLNTGLEKRVCERTVELNTSLEKINELKLQQDADYFLTSLLLSPLSRNENKSENVRAEFFFRQKKIFEFRKKIYEIGGDISICTNIQLENKNYTVFINADAMGKSIQGAGGALVLGVVFHAIIARSHTRSFKNTSPEKWMQELFLELQKVFESFNGSMYISAVIGLIDDATGLMYYINAEHPYSVIYRKGKAYFLEEDLFIRKLGTPDNEHIFSIMTIPLFPGDILIAGSDGRDDLIVGTIDGIRIFNEDQNEFLKRVEESRANLPEIISGIERFGEFSDDFSILKIEYFAPEMNQRKAVFSQVLSNIYNDESFSRTGANLQDSLYFMKTLYKVMPLNETANYFLGLYYFRKREFKLSLKHILSYLQKHPESDGMLYLSCIAYKRIGNFRKALEIGEQINLRRPDWKKNLLNLKDLYLLSGNEEKAKKYSQKLKEKGKNEIQRNKMQSTKKPRKRVQRVSR
jgi:tetratricopeptide (TPR) repeat protein